MQSLENPVSEPLGRSIGFGIICACIYLTALTPLFCVSFFTLSPLFYIGLRDGVKSTFIASACAFVLIMLASNIVVGLSVVIFFMIPCLYLLHYALLKPFDQRLNYQLPDDWYPLSHLIQHLLSISLVIMGLILIYLSLTFNHDKIAQIYPTVIQYFDNALLKWDIEKFTFIFKIIPGFMGLGFFIMMAINATVAQQILVFQQKNSRPHFDSYNFELTSWPGIGLIINGASALLFQGSIIADFSRNVVLVLLGAFMIQGMSIFHVLSQGIAYKKIFLSVCYFLLILLSWLGGIVAFLGILEPWLQLRQKIKGIIRK